MLNDTVDGSLAKHPSPRYAIVICLTHWDGVEGRGGLDLTHGWEPVEKNAEEGEGARKLSLVKTDKLNTSPELDLH